MSKLCLKLNQKIIFLKTASLNSNWPKSDWCLPVTKFFLFLREFLKFITKLHGHYTPIYKTPR